MFSYILVHEILYIIQEPVEKKKRKMFPQSSPSSPPSPTQAMQLLDDDYSDWTPPTGKIKYDN
jgi:hypothetical protein